MRRLRYLVALVFTSMLLTACDFDVYSLPLPGGADVGDEPIEVEVEFADVLDLVPQSAVRFNEVSVGRVTKIRLGGEGNRTAIATLLVRGDTELPANTHAAIRQTSLLGEKFVDLRGPALEAPQGILRDGDEIPLSRTGRNPEVEEVLGALSLLLNGGGLAQMRTIAKEVNAALEGREENVKSAFRQVASFMEQLDDNKDDIVNALEGLDRLSREVRRQQGSIDRALDELPSAVLSLDRQRDDLVRMLEALNELSDVGVRVIDQTKDVTIESFELLTPVLTRLVASGDHLVDAVEALTFPFVDATVGRDPQVARNLHMGDYVNLSVTFRIDLANPSLPTICIEEIQHELPCNEIIRPIFDCIESGGSNCGSVLVDIISGLGGTGNPLTDGLQNLQQTLGLGRVAPLLGTADPADLGLSTTRTGDGPLADLGTAHDPSLAVVLGAPLAQGGTR
jgi:phospholipid/cholesterol/gamma-HCH transport system substrate-binding protein